ncbi:MAG: GNAT family N-acetyltransferase [Myxococcaceae bacterium]
MIELRQLSWDSAFFGLRIARLETRQLFPTDIAGIEAWCSQERIDCLYFLTDASEPESAAVAEAAGFERVDQRVTLAIAPLSGGSRLPRHVTRLATGDDVSALEHIAGEAHRQTRFFNDVHFPRERCAELYRTWIRNDCSGAADAVWLCQDAKGPVGYVSCHLRASTLGEIGLLGVIERARGQKYGQTLVATALSWLHEEGCTKAQVVTQGNNLPARRLYEAAGFALTSSQFWYHRWPTRRP